MSHGVEKGRVIGAKDLSIGESQGSQGLSREESGESRILVRKSQVSQGSV